ncbi:MAG: hypothetical protein HOG34_12465 [Bacteroidetes bacterium]|nr:hypothetical protein [Bacteroidota bacterium]
MKAKRYLLALYISCMLCMASLFSMNSLAQKIEVPLRFDHYYTYDQVNEALRALNKAYPKMTHLDLVGHSDEGREIWSITVNNPKTGLELSKPGLYLDGNIHGNEIQAGEVALYYLNYILTNYEKNPRVTEMLDRTVTYCVPSVNVDGRYHFFHEINVISNTRGLRIAKDDDKDGLVDEDPMDDLDGDGNITRMRKKVPFGDYRLDPNDSRIMIRVAEDEIGDYILLGSEGIDNDNDGRINEDGVGYIDPNRNWGFNWQPNYVEGGAGSYPLEGAGLKDLAKYLLDRPNILMAWAFHNSGGMFLRGPTSKLAKEYDRRDTKVYDYLGAHAEKMVPGYKYMISWKDLYTTWGDFGDYTDNVIGAFTLVGELFQSNTETYRKETAKATPRDQRDQERMDFNDYLALGQMFVDWKPYKHPVYGDIEIGGWTKFTSRLPQPFMLMDLVHRNAMAVFHTVDQLPDIKIELMSKEEVEKDLYKIRIRLVNKKGISSNSYQSVRDKIHPQDQLILSGKKIKVLTGGRLTDEYNDLVSYKEHRPEIQFFYIPGFSHVEYQFLVKGKGKIKVEYKSLKARNKTIEVN